MSVYHNPKGLLGELSEFIHAQATRQSQEIALAGAIGLLSGITGRAYNISGTGLNQYTLVLAQTGTGKEAIADAYDKLIDCVGSVEPSFCKFIGPAECKNIQGHLSKNSKSFVSLVGEFGITMQQMAEHKSSDKRQELRKFLLDVYNKSGFGKKLRPRSGPRSPKSGILSPSCSILGESTPEEFYRGVIEEVVADGLLPRFLVIEYNGDRKPLNKEHYTVEPSAQLINSLATLCKNADTLNQSNRVINIGIALDAERLLDNFDMECDSQINASEREVRRHLWGRAHVKALKLAAITAVGINHYKPIIDAETAFWAINIVKTDCERFVRMFKLGGVGKLSTSGIQAARMTDTIRDWVKGPWDRLERYAKDYAVLDGHGIIPHTYMQRRLCSTSPFKHDKAGSKEALDRTVELLLDNAILAPANSDDLDRKYGIKAKCYHILDSELLRN